MKNKTETPVRSAYAPLMKSLTRAVLCVLNAKRSQVCQPGAFHPAKFWDGEGWSSQSRNSRDTRSKPISR